MNFELFIALHYLFARRKQAFIYLISIMSILGVAIGVASLVVVLGVYNGFTIDIRDKILGANAHIIITGNFNTPIVQPPVSTHVQNNIPTMSSNTLIILDKLKKNPVIIGATPFIYTECMISSPHGVKGLILRGIDPSSAQKVISILSHLTEGMLEHLIPKVKGAPEGIIIGNELAQRLSIVPGSRINLLSPTGQKTSSGFQPRIRSFTVTGIFHTGMFEYDTSLAFISLDAARELLGLPSDYISGIEINIHDVYQANYIANQLQKELGHNFSVRSWMDMNANLFAALKLEKIGMFIILAMVVLIGSFSIVTMLIMLVMEKTRDIAILISMGATSQMIRFIFILQGTIIGIVGTFLGYLLGITLAFLLQKYQFIKLPPGVYTLDHLPILLNWLDILTIGASAMLLCFFATLYPAYQAARLQPIEGLRYE